MAGTDLKSLGWQHLGLAERKSVLAEPGLAPPCEPSRLQHFRSTAGLDEDACFQAWLAEQHLSEQLLSHLLGEGPRSATSPVPAAGGAVSAVALSEAEQACVAGAFPFARVLRGFAAGVAERLAAHGVPPALRPALLQEVVRQAHFLAGRALVLELNVARVLGQLQGATPEERFARFLDAPDTWTACLRQYPVLARLLEELAERFPRLVAETLSRLSNDAVHLARAGLIDSEHDPLVELSPGLSDPHRGGRTVCEARYASGSRVFYKPRSLAVDLAFGRLLRAVNEAGFSLPLLEPRVLDLGSNGYAAHITHELCANEAELARFYHRQGGLLALVHLLRGVDFHNENVIAHRDQPVLIDLECLFHQDAAQLSEASPLERRVNRSVLSTGLLTWRLRMGGATVEVGGLGGLPQQRIPIEVPTWGGERTDSMALGAHEAELPVAQNLPAVNTRPLEYADDFVAGFEEMYSLLVERREELARPGGLLDTFRDVPTRCLLRPTGLYATALFDATHPDFLRDGADRDAILNRHLETSAAHSTDGIRSSELGDLWAGDVPAFHGRPGDTLLTHGEGEPCARLAREPLNEAREAFAAWGPTDREQTTRLIRGALEAAYSEEGGAHRAAAGPADRQEEAAAPDELFQAAIELGDELLRLAVRAGGRATWYGFGQTPDEHWEYEPVGSGLYSGGSGIALFLALLAAHTREARFAEVALEAARHVSDQFRHRADGLLLGAFSGWSSAGYALARIAGLLGEPELRALALDMVRATLSATSSDEELDVIGGVAGTALVARRLMADDAQDLRLVLEACAHRLLERPGIPERRPADDEPRPLLAGAAHGAAGLAWALAELHAVTGDERLLHRLGSLCAYERQLYDPAEGNWPDLRPGRQSPRGGVMAWCHGAPGIGLARLLLLDALPALAEARADVDLAVAATLARGELGNASLCHGSLGNAELLVAASAHGRPELLLTARSWARRALERRRHSGGWSTGVPFRTPEPSLLLGLAGIGYQLLRLAAPERVPSLLGLGVEPLTPS
ncbi:MAG TPA: type 2 lanthipeptide synthetase LanM [Myxococcaceae bacterium]|jgi:type 2 lantibiotic biosynthesis protein LanM